ncbi:MAG TPA: hypothetical protein VH054_04870 [Polyangiaceae bacterium]|jgi:hypothetical protein|nr:hypothetical protein [Polyangiaceae bacterium]
MKRALLLSIMMCAACKDEAKTDTAASASAAASAPPTVASVAPSVTASAPAPDRTDCPPPSTGPGTFGKPCEAKGTSRMVELTWKGKYDDKGAPTFNVHSTAPKTMLYGRVAVYFYDKAGKLIDVKEAPEGSDKTHAFHTCSGNVFSGGLAPSEKAAYNFSCMGKANIPDGMASMEAEAFMVGFADSTVKKNEYYWRNNDLTPETRAKGGVK